MTAFLYIQVLAGRKEVCNIRASIWDMRGSFLQVNWKSHIADWPAIFSRSFNQAWIDQRRLGGHWRRLSQGAILKEGSLYD